MFATGETVGLAEWIIDDTCLVTFILDDITYLIFSFQRQFMVMTKPEQTIEIINDHEPFLYRLVGTWAFSPHPKHWREFLDWFNSLDNENFDPYVPGLITSDWLHMHNAMGKRHMTWVSIIIHEPILFYS